jgi:hypothetical protein
MLTYLLKTGSVKAIKESLHHSLTLEEPNIAWIIPTTIFI